MASSNQLSSQPQPSTSTRSRSVAPQHVESSQPDADYVPPHPFADSIKGLELNLTIPDRWLTLSTDAKVATCSQIRECALIGVRELSVFDPEKPRLRLGGRNARPIHHQSAKRIAHDVYHDSGPRRLTAEMALTLVIRRSWIKEDSWPKHIDPMNYKSLPPISFTSIGHKAAAANQVHVINGQHRYEL